MTTKKPSPKLPPETKLVLSAAKKFVTKPGEKTRLAALVEAVEALPEEQYEEVDLGEEEEVKPSRARCQTSWTTSRGRGSNRRLVAA